MENDEKRAERSSFTSCSGGKVRKRWAVGGMFREVMMSRRGPCSEVKKKKKRGGKKQNDIWGKNVRTEEMSGMK